MRSLLLFQRMAADEIQQRKKEDPDNIDEVPIQSEVINGGSMPVGIRAMVCLEEKKKQNAEAHDHVERVHTGHSKVQKEEELRMLRHIRSQRNIPLVSRMNKILYAEACPRD